MLNNKFKNRERQILCIRLKYNPRRGLECRGSLFPLRSAGLRDLIQPKRRRQRRERAYHAIHLRRDYERRWAARMVRDETRQLPQEGTDTCVLRSDGRCSRQFDLFSR
jgi:hypothetical protein